MFYEDSALADSHEFSIHYSLLMHIAQKADVFFWALNYP